MTTQVDRNQQIFILERQCENQMSEFERNFNYSHSQEVLRSILVQIESISQRQNESEEEYVQNDIEFCIQQQRLEARVYECLGTIYLSLSLPNQSLSVFERASNLMLSVQEHKSNIPYDQNNKLHDRKNDQNNNKNDLKIIARILIKTSFALFLLSEQKSSYRLLRDAHTFLKQNNLLETEEEALLFFNFGNFYRFNFQDELSETCYQRCIHIREKLFGKTSPIVYDAKQELAKLFIESGQLSQAEQLIEEVIHFKINQYGEQSPSTSVSYFYRASLLFITSANVDDALQDVLKSIQINTLCIGEYNKINAECYLLLGKIFAKKQSMASSNFNNQYQLWNNKQLNTPFTWAQYKSTTNPDSSHSPSSSSSSSKSSSQQFSSNTLTSPDYQTPSYLNLQQLKFNKFSFPIIQENKIANLYQDGQADLLLKYQQIYQGEERELYQVYFNKAVIILKTLFGEYNECVGIAYNAIGKVLLSLKQYEKALNYFNTAIEIYQCQQNANSFTAYSQNLSQFDNQEDFNFCLYFAIKNAADCNMKLGRLKTAHQLYQQILSFKNSTNSSFQIQQQQKNQQEQQLPFTFSFTSTTQSIILNNTQSSTIEDEHKKLFVSPIDINSQQIMQLLNQSRTED